jgi:hypothetical protein
MRQLLGIALLATLVAGLGCAPGSDRGDDGAGLAPGKADLPSGAAPGHMAPAWLLALSESGTWQEEDEEATTRAWVNARVANRRFHKRVWAETAVPYAGGAVLRTLHPADWKATLDDGAERWGIDTLELHDTLGPTDIQREGPALVRFRMQEDPDDDGTDQIIVTPWSILEGAGEPALPGGDPWSPGWYSPIPVGADAGAQPVVLYPPFDDAGQDVVERIDALTHAALADPETLRSLHAAIFNINDPRITDALLGAHAAGVDVRLVTEGTKFRPFQTWQTEYARLVIAGVPLLGVVRPGTGAMHDKFALFDGGVLATGSFNWEWGSSFENHENMLVTDQRSLVSAYARRFEVLAGELQRPREFAADPGGEVSVSFAPDEAPYRVAGQVIDAATESLEVAMFTCKDVTYTDDGVETSLFEKLAAAVERGVAVTVITDYGIAEAAEYYGVMSEDDPMDELLASYGVHVVLADNTFGTYASMHHKFAVADAATVLTGAFNWYYDAAYRNDEDQILWRDPGLAADYRGEITDLLHRYDLAWDASTRPQVEVTIEAYCDATQPGDGLVLTGDLADLGAWDPAAGLVLDPEDWPLWRGTFTAPAGLRFEHKLVITGDGGGQIWQQGDNRLSRIPTDPDAAILPLQY